MSFHGATSSIYRENILAKTLFGHEGGKIPLAPAHPPAGSSGLLEKLVNFAFERMPAKIDTNLMEQMRT